MTQSPALYRNEAGAETIDIGDALAFPRLVGMYLCDACRRYAE